MGKEFTAVFPDGTKRFAGSLSVGRAKLFFELALLLERFAGKPCGISPDDGLDNHCIDPMLFSDFFETIWQLGWVAESGGFVAGWASHAAGMIDNYTLEPRKWVDRRGVPLKVARYLRPDEVAIDQ